MKKLYSLLSTLPFIFCPVSVFACGGSSSIISGNPFLIIFLLYTLIVGIIYVVNFKKLLNEKWGFLQYVIIILVVIPGLFALFAGMFISELIFSSSPGVYDGSSVAVGIEKSSYSPSIIGGFILAIFLILFPMLVRKRWVYTWGFALYFLFIFFILLLAIRAMNSILCSGGNAIF